LDKEGRLGNNKNQLSVYLCQGCRLILVRIWRVRLAIRVCSGESVKQTNSSASVMILRIYELM
jgi:hypothetical protein